MQPDAPDEVDEENLLLCGKLRDSCFETYTSLIHSIFQRVSPQSTSTERCATQKLLPLCLAGASKLIASVIETKDLPFETRTAAAALLG